MEDAKRKKGGRKKERNKTRINSKNRYNCEIRTNAILQREDRKDGTV